MDAKITKTRLSHMLSYDWLKMIGTVAGVIVLWVLVFTMTATKITPSQQFSVINYTGTYTTDSYFDRLSNALGKDGVLSHEVIEYSTVDIQNAGNELAGTMMETRLQTDEGDVLFVADVDDPSTGYVPEGAAEGEKAYYTYYDVFLRRYFYYIDRLDGETGYLKRMEEYLSTYYENGYEDESSFNEAKVEADFRARIKKNKDKRYKKESQIVAALDDEIARIKGYRAALVNFYFYVGSGFIELEERTVEVVVSYGETQPITGVFSVNICPNEETMGELKKDIYYMDKRADEENPDKTVTVACAKDMQFVFLKTSGMSDEYRFESLAYLNYLVETHCTAEG